MKLNVMPAHILCRVKESIYIVDVMLVISFAIPVFILYYLYPDSFQTTNPGGRTFHFFFLWLVFLEIISGRRSLGQFDTTRCTRSILITISLLLPTIYVVGANVLGLNAIIVEVARQSNVPLAVFLPLSLEYLVFGALFALTTLLVHGREGLLDFSVPLFFVLSLGAIYIIDDLYPFGRFTPFQILVPATTTLAANVLNFMGYQTRIQFTYHPIYGSAPTLSAWDAQGSHSSFAIAWPCAGVESLIIYAVVITLSLKKISLPWKHRIIYFLIGAFITYSINILRVVAFFMISLNGGDISSFHGFYGWLYSVIWIVSYPLIIIGSRSLWKRLRYNARAQQVSLSSQLPTHSTGFTPNYKLFETHN